MKIRDVNKAYLFNVCLPMFSISANVVRRGGGAVVWTEHTCVTKLSISRPAFILEDPNDLNNV